MARASPRDRRGRFKKYLPGKGFVRVQRGAAWRRFAEEQKAKAGWRCEECGRPESEMPLQAHHRFALSKGGPLFPDNPDCKVTGLQVLCQRCHDKKRHPASQREWYDLLDDLEREGY